MANPSAPVQEVSRLLDLVPYLSTHSHISLKELATEFGVSEKEIAQELTALSMCGLPGYTPYELIEIFFESGFVTINNHDPLNIPRALTPLEIASLLIGLEILKDSIAQDSIAQDSGGNQDSPLRTKIDSLIKELKALAGGAIHVDENLTSALQGTIERAIAHRKTLSIHYQSPIKDLLSQREVEPLSLRSERAHTYLVAFCLTAQAVRHFRLDRVVACEELDRTTTREEWEESQASVTVEISVTGDRRSIAESLAAPEIGAGGPVSVEIFSLEWMAKSTIAHAPFIEVKSPVQVRETVRLQAEKILALYSS